MVLRQTDRRKPARPHLLRRRLSPRQWTVNKTPTLSAAMSCDASHACSSMRSHERIPLRITVTAQCQKTFDENNGSYILERQSGGSRRTGRSASARTSIQRRFGFHRESPWSIGEIPAWSGKNLPVRLLDRSSGEQLRFAIPPPVHRYRVVAALRASAQRHCRPRSHRGAN